MFCLFYVLVVLGLGTTLILYRLSDVEYFESTLNFRLVAADAGQQKKMSSNILEEVHFILDVMHARKKFIYHYIK